MTDAHLWALSIIAALIAVMSALGAVYYNSNILPLKMAEKGYCWQVVTATGNVYASYAPCKGVTSEATAK